MHDHEFERQVHQKMEGLHLDPSGAVWERVEGQLHKKKRRRIIFWLPLSLVVLFAGGYILQHNSHLNTAVLASPPALSYNNNNRTAEIGRIKTTANSSKGSSTALSGSLRPTGGAPAGGKNGKQTAALNNTPHLPIAYTPNNQRGINKNIYAAISSKQQAVATTSSLMEEKEIFSSVEPGITQPDSLPSNEPAASILSSVPYSHEPFRTLFVNPSGKDVAIQTVKLSKRKSLHWGINAAITKTSVYSGNLSLNKLFSSEDKNYQALPNQNTTGNSTTGNVVVSTPSAIKSGTGFSAGFFLRKDIGARWFVSTGLDYALYRTSIMIGSSRNSSPAQFYSSGADRYFLTGSGSDSHPYTNSYHFVGLPLLLQFQINKGRLPIVWEGGVEVARLLSSNALHYNSTLRGYYKDSRLLNHTQFYVLTGLQINAFSCARYPVNIGPQLQVGLSNLSRISAGNQEHLIRYGLKVSTIIK